MLRVAVAWFALFAGLLAACGHVSAQEPVETPTPVAQATAVAIELHDDGLGAYSWDAVGGAAEYRLRVELTIVRGNAVSPFCAPPIQPQTERLTADEVLPATETSFAFLLPPLPEGDAWFGSEEVIELSAVDAAGATIGGARRQGISETRCSSLSEPLVVGSCTIPAGWYEVTGPEAVERGQRVFESPGAASRIYVYAGGSCVHLALGEGDAPEYAPEPIIPTDGATGLRPPRTGQGSPSPAAPSGRGVSLMLLGMIMVTAGIVLSRRPAKS